MGVSFDFDGKVAIVAVAPISVDGGADLDDRCPDRIIRGPPDPAAAGPHPNRRVPQGIRTSCGREQREFGRPVSAGRRGRPEGER
jgi:hypothetical protein